MLDLRGDNAQLVAGDRERVGVRFKQNGEWDDRILCADHERIIGDADDYGVRFCREWRRTRQLAFEGQAFELRNVHPERLLRFSYAVIWRHAAARDGPRPKLGKYEGLIREALLGDGPYDLQMFMGASPLTLGGKQIDIAMAPTNERVLHFNFVHFSIAGLSFHLKTDQRPFPTSWAPYLVNGNRTVVLSRLNDMDMRQVPKFRTIIKNMTSRRRGPQW